jgi:thiol-disulfide isomerase/thioredoxin
MRRLLVVLLAINLLWIGVREARAIDPYAGTDPYWVLLHEPAVIEELKLGPAQRQAYAVLLDELDLRFFPLRNKPRDEARAGVDQIVVEARQRLKSILQPAQSRRLNEILLRFLGNGSLLHDDVVARLRYTDVQKKRLKEITDETEIAVTGLKDPASGSNSRESWEKRYMDLKSNEQKKLLAVLKPDQQSTLKNLLGSPFPLSDLRQPAFKAPELVDTGEWINTSPFQLDKLRGKVVVLHFYASGCINCIHNYPSYRKWHEEFKDNVVVIGIHTPETAGERETANVRRKAAEEKLAFPILIDGKSENWNAWGNSMWPAVYLIDKRGYTREFWPGELKWKGNDGEKHMRKKIEGLLAERSPPPESASR